MASGSGILRRLRFGIVTSDIDFCTARADHLYDSMISMVFNDLRLWCSRSIIGLCRFNSFKFILHHFQTVAALKLDIVTL